MSEGPFQQGWLNRLRGEDVFLIGNDTNNKLLVQYKQEHYQTRVEVLTVFSGMTFTVSKIRKLPES